MSNVELPLQPGPIIHPSAAPLRSLIVTMAIMSYLACLAIGALLLINRAVDGWTSGLSREVTVQIRILNGVDVEGELIKAETILRSISGVKSVDVLDRDAGAKLLEPWLGAGDLSELPIPRLIRVTIDEVSPPDFAELELVLKKEVQGASLDTHRRWQAELTRLARNLSFFAFAILLLIATSAVAMVIFATRTVLDANRNVVEVLHLVGAHDNYIASQIDRRFLSAGLISGSIGVGGGFLTIGILAYAFGGEINGIAAAGKSLLFAPELGAWSHYMAFLSVPLVATIIAVVTSRLTLMRMLDRAS
jgi:cell division transport system permease protein